MLEGWQAQNEKVELLTMRGEWQSGRLPDIIFRMVNFNHF